MNKSSYYYKKLAQAIIFTDVHWTEIVDSTDPHDNIYTEDFLISLRALVAFYQRKACLEAEDVNRLQAFLSDLRFDYPYQSRTERKALFPYINEMIAMANCITDEGTEKFYMEEYKKRYGIYAKTPIGKELLARYWAYCLDEDPREIKIDLAWDIYPLTLLFYEIKNLTHEHLKNFLLTDYLLSTINALECEKSSLLEDSNIRQRFLYLLRKNQRLIANGMYESSGNENDDKLFIKQNQMVLKRLERHY